MVNFQAHIDIWVAVNCFAAFVHGALLCNELSVLKRLQTFNLFSGQAAVIAIQLLAAAAAENSQCPLA